MAINLGDDVTVHINRIEVQSDDPDRIAFGLVESAEALKRVADERLAERRNRDSAAVAASTTPCQSYGCTGRMVRIEGTVGYGCSKCNAWESALTAESRGQGTATRMSAASLPTHWEKKAPLPCNPTLYNQLKEMFTRQRESNAAMLPWMPHACSMVRLVIVLRPDVDPLDVEYDGHALRDLIERDRIARHTDQPKAFTPAQRAAVSAHWSAQLRAKVDAAKQAERNVVTYCDLDSDD